MYYISFSFLLFIFVLTSCNQNQQNFNAQKDKTPQVENDNWWKEGILYQIYPQSFKDTNGDGFGDFKGVTEQLDYLQDLGITMVWMNPFFESPLVDNGYDVSNYREVHPRYGTMDDFDAMLAGMHQRGIKFILDVVVNHSSDQHPWFQQSRSSRDNPYRDYYHWWPAEKGTPPYRHSLFDPEGAWQFDSLSNAYYLHYFADAQPDLNWENPKVRQEVYDIMKFWADKGVDGFRMDAFQFASKDTTFPKWPKGHEKDFIRWYGMRPQLHTYLNEMYDEVLSKYDIFAVAEGAGSSFEEAHQLVDADRNELQMAYHFEYVDMANSTSGFELSEFKEVFSKWDSAFAKKGWLAIYLSNHDKSRLVNRFGNPNPKFRTVSTQLLHTFLLSMRGTPYMYYGDELGMTNLDMPAIDAYVDVAAIGDYETAKKKGFNLDSIMVELNHYSRENSRTPMQWDTTAYAGFTNATPWKRVNPNYKEINVAVQLKNPHSVLNHFKKMTTLRKQQPALIYGDYTILQKEHPTIYAFTRTYKGEKILALFNFSENESNIVINTTKSNITELINNYDAVERNGDSFNLKPYQAVLFDLNNSN